MTPDGLPLVRSAGIDGVYVHGSHGSIGMQSAPGTARILGEIMEGRPGDGVDQFVDDPVHQPMNEGEGRPLAALSVLVLSTCGSPAEDFA
jgi:hypothetical protein